uniref:Odorant receptor n=1 Tax=Campoletis chlorideae TaxID=219166 RepID=A0A346D3V9_9HYME|nr:odorant receptor [Campoletis chlorideae]
MTDVLEKYKFYEGTLRRALLFTGLWPGSKLKIRHRLLTAYHGIIGIIVACAVINFCHRYFANRDRFMKGLALLLAFFTVFLKTTSFIFYRKRLGDLHHSLAGTFKRDLENEELRPILLSPLLWFYRPTILLASSTWASIALCWFRPLIFIAIQRSKGVTILKWILPFSTVYPWPIDPHTWRYPAHYAFEVYSGICLAIFSSSSDALFGFYVFQISAQLRTLSHRVRKLGSSKNYHQEIRECVNRHEILAKCQAHVNQIYGPVVLWLLITNAVIMCALIYQASHLGFQKAIVVVVYIVMKSVQTLVYGWFGTFLATECDNFREAVYSCDWPGSGEKRLMKDVSILLMYKPFILSACGVANVSVDMFVNVSNTAMSYFFMLRTLDEQKESSGT